MIVCEQAHHPLKHSPNHHHTYKRSKQPVNPPFLPPHSISNLQSQTSSTTYSTNHHASFHHHHHHHHHSTLLNPRHRNRDPPAPGSTWFRRRFLRRHVNCSGSVRLEFLASNKIESRLFDPSENDPIHTYIMIDSIRITI